MKEFFTDFLMLLANSVLLICFALMSFLLISNFYHSGEVSYQYYVDIKEDAEYKEYKKILSDVQKKMDSVDYQGIDAGVTSQPIYQYYKGCVDALNAGTFAKFENQSSVNALDIYKANNEVLKDYNSKCIFYISYNISNFYADKFEKDTFDGTEKSVAQKSDVILKNAEYLTESGLGNSSYSFTTDVVRATIYDKIENELDLTINNYKMIAYILDDIADWYVAEFGGNE